MTVTHAALPDRTVTAQLPSRISCCVVRIVESGPRMVATSSARTDSPLYFFLLGRACARALAAADFAAAEALLCRTFEAVLATLVLVCFGLVLFGMFPPLF